MKLKEYLYMAGIKPKIREFGYEIRDFQIEDYGLVQYAQWLHPAESKNSIKGSDIGELNKFLNKGDFAIDIGAYTGDTTIPMALAVGKDGCVLALEPNRYVYKILEKNSKLNLNKTNIIPLMLAAAETDGMFEFEYSDSGFCNGGLHKNISKWKHGHAFKLKVNGANIEKLLKAEYPGYLKKLKFIKIDAEGYDLFILKSIFNILKDYRPYIKAEIFKHTSFEYRKELFNLLNSLDYLTCRVNNDSDLKGDSINPSGLVLVTVP